MGRNKLDGIDYNTREELKKAKTADLVTLPKEVEGTHCFNCRFIKVIDEKTGVGFCEHPSVKLNVTKRMCCAFWDHKGAERSWEAKKNISE